MDHRHNQRYEKHSQHLDFDRTFHFFFAHSIFPNVFSISLQLSRRLPRLIFYTIFVSPTPVHFIFHISANGCCSCMHGIQKTSILAASLTYDKRAKANLLLLPSHRNTFFICLSILVFLRFLSNFSVRIYPDPTFSFAK